MLIRSTWTLAPAGSAVLPRAYSLELVKILHDRLDWTIGEEAIPSTSYSGLIGRATANQDFLTFHPEDHYQLVLCGLHESSAKAIAHLDLGDSIEFLGTTFTISDRHDETTSYETLYHNLIVAEPEPQNCFDLQFITPTAFAQNRTYLPLPVPTLMFRSWLERWNHFAPVYLGGADLLGYLGETIALNRHRLQTQSFRNYKGYIVGFQGTLRLRILKFADPLLANVANLLLSYAQFSGTGIKTRLGMGQTRRLSSDE